MNLLSSTSPPSSLEFELPDEVATHDLARRLARLATSRDIVALRGELGAGKTSFARAFVREFLGVADEEVPSPTFTLVQTYEGVRGSLWHIDAYRLRHPDEIWELGLEEALVSALLLIEWPERLGGNLPARRLDIHIAPGPTAGARQVSLIAQGGSDWLARLQQTEPL